MEKKHKYDFIKKYCLVFTILVLFSLQIQSQTVKEILTNVQNKVTNSNFKVNLKYQLFKGVESKKILESFNGIYIKKETNYYNKVKNTETIIGTDFLIKINHDQKAMIYDKFKKGNNDPNNMLNITALLKNFENPKVTDLGNRWKCEMIAVEYSQMPYSKIVMYINKEDYNINKQVLFLTSLMNFSDDGSKNDFNIPRLEIEYTNYSKPTKQDDYFFVKSQYIDITKSKVVPSTKYKAYEIINSKNI